MRGVDMETNLDDACSFTGHRPNKLRGGYNVNSLNNLILAKETERIIVRLIEENGVNVFYTGGALGFDTIAFLVIERLRRKGYEHLKNILAVPFFNQDSNWLPGSVELYRNMKEVAQEVVYVDELPQYKIPRIPTKIYDPAKMQKRNEYMVDQSKFVIGAWNGTSGGTRNCLRYAEKLSKEIILIDKKFL